MKLRPAFFLLVALSLLTPLSYGQQSKEKDEIVVSFTLMANHIIIPVSINDKPAKAMVDTGYESNILLPSEAATFGVDIKTSTSVVKVAEFTIPDLKWTIVDAKGVSSIRDQIGVGILLGAPFLHRYRVTFDFKKNEIHFRKLEAKVPDLPPKATVIPFENFRGGIILQVKLNGQGPFRAVIDTGSPYIRATPEALQKAHAPEGEAVIVDTLQVGSITLTQMKISSQPDLTAILKRANLDMLLGLRFLSRFTVTVDYQKKELVLTEQ